MFGRGECISEVVMNKTKFRQNPEIWKIQNQEICKSREEVVVMTIQTRACYFKVISIKHLLLNSHQLNLRIMSRNKVLSQVHRSRIKMGGTKKRSNSLKK